MEPGTPQSQSDEATTSARRQVASGPSAVWAHEDSHSTCSPVSAAPLGLRRPSALTLPCRAQKGQTDVPSRARMSRPHLLLPPPLPRPPRPAASVSPTEETAPAVVPAASPTGIPSSETTTPSPGASPPAPEPEKPPGSLGQPAGWERGVGEGTSLGSTSELCPQLLSHWARRSCLRTGSLTQRSSAAAACRSWSPLLPTDTTPVLPLPPLSRAALAVTRPATKCPLPLRVHQGVMTPQL